MFCDIPRNVWRHSPEYNILPILHVPHIPFPVPVFLVLYIAQLLVQKVYLFRLQKEELSIHIKIYYAYTSTCSAVLHLDEGGITYYVTLTLPSR